MTTTEPRVQPEKALRALQILGTFICFLALVGHRWSEMLFKMADSEFKDALGDRYLQMLPELTKFTLQTFHSSYWSLGEWIPLGAILVLWMVKRSWIIAVVDGLMALWLVVFLCVSPLSFWFGDMMIVHAIEANAEKAKLLPK